MEETKGEIKTPQKREEFMGISRKAMSRVSSSIPIIADKYQIRVFGPVEEQTLDEDDEDGNAS